MSPSVAPEDVGRWEDGPPDAPWTLLLAHGAGAGPDHPSLVQLAKALAARGHRVVRYEFPYMARRRLEGVKAGPDRPPVLDATTRHLIATTPRTGRLALAGRSMGARSAGRVADEAGADAMIGIGFPFHPPGKPDRLRLDDLPAATPVLIVQGERDPFGKPEEVAGYALPSGCTVHWSPDGDHGLTPRKASGRTLDDNLADAADAIHAFLTR